MNAKQIKKMNEEIRAMSDEVGEKEKAGLEIGDTVEYDTAFSGRAKCRIVGVDSTTRNEGGFLHTVELEILSYTPSQMSDFDSRNTPPGTVFRTPAGNCIKIKH